MKENSNLKNDIENEGSLLDINNYINNNIKNFPINTNFYDIIELSTDKHNKKITLNTLEKKNICKIQYQIQNKI